MNEGPLGIKYSIEDGGTLGAIVRVKMLGDEKIGVALVPKEMLNNNNSDLWGYVIQTACYEDGKPTDYKRVWSELIRAEAYKIQAKIDGNGVCSEEAIQESLTIQREETIP